MYITVYPEFLSYGNNNHYNLINMKKDLSNENIINEIKNSQPDNVHQYLEISCLKLQLTMNIADTFTNNEINQEEFTFVDKINKNKVKEHTKSVELPNKYQIILISQGKELLESIISSNTFAVNGTLPDYSYLTKNYSSQNEQKITIALNDNNYHFITARLQMNNYLMEDTLIEKIIQIDSEIMIPILVNY